MCIAQSLTIKCKEFPVIPNTKSLTVFVLPLNSRSILDRKHNYRRHSLLDRTEIQHTQKRNYLSDHSKKQWKNVRKTPPNIHLVKSESKSLFPPTLTLSRLCDNHVAHREKGFFPTISSNNGIRHCYIFFFLLLLLIFSGEFIYQFHLKILSKRGKTRSLSFGFLRVR